MFLTEARLGFFCFVLFSKSLPGSPLAGQFSAVYAHEGYNLFKFVGQFLLARLVVLVEGPEDLHRTGMGERRGVIAQVKEKGGPFTSGVEDHGGLT